MGEHKETKELAFIKIFKFEHETETEDFIEPYKCILEQAKQLDHENLLKIKEFTIEQDSKNIYKFRVCIISEW